MGVVILGVVFLWVLALQAYWTLPETIPSHFDFQGRPDAQGSRSTVLVLATVFSLVPVILLLVVRYRFVLLHRWPELLNLPGYFLYARLLPPERRALWFNRYFEVLVYLDAALVLFFLVLEWGILQGIRQGRLPTWFTPVALLAPLLFLGPLVYRFLYLSRELRQEARRFSSPS